MNRLPHYGKTDLLRRPPSTPICCYFIPCNRFSEETSITTLHRPAPSPLPSKRSMCAFTPRSAGGTAPYAWSCSVVSSQVSKLGFNSNVHTKTNHKIISETPKQCASGTVTLIFSPTPPHIMFLIFVHV